MSSESRDLSPGYMLKRAQQALRRAMDVALREIDLTTPQYALLDALSLEPSGLSNAELARRCFVTAQAMHGVVVMLEKRELIDRQAEAPVGRVRTACLTSDGQRLHARASRAVVAIEEHAFSSLSKTERSQLLSVLHDVTERLETF